MSNVTVKPLEWSRENPYHVARILGGHYSIEVTPYGTDLRGTFLNETYPSFESAKSAAQQDYEARILSAIEVSE